MPGLELVATNPQLEILPIITMLTSTPIHSFIQLTNQTSIFEISFFSRVNCREPPCTIMISQQTRLLCWIPKGKKTLVLLDSIENRLRQLNRRRSLPSNVIELKFDRKPSCAILDSTYVTYRQLIRIIGEFRF